ncbi:MAG: 4Fe-4S dicluster domain-containing protein [Dehalococcoidia bacterium]|nr:4Fe-4S dicluster domain-containing protein [Dehalococcoidia bacterium]
MTNADRDGGADYRPLSSAGVFDEAWEKRARQALDVAGWNSELAVQAARDALAVVSGKLSEDEFHARHREAYLREFGVDLRPKEEAAETDEAPAAVATAPVAVAEAPAATITTRPGHNGLSRRSALGLAGGGVAALLLGDLVAARTGEAGAVATGDGDAGGGIVPAAQGEAASEGKRKIRWGMVMDLEKCNGCLQCIATCKKEHALPDGVFWIYVMAFKEPDRPGDANLLVRTCQHCSNAPCVKVCPTGARHRRDDGLVLTDYDVCFGCRYCQVSCPYGVNYFGWDDPDEKFTGQVKDARGKKVDGAPPRGMMGKCVFDPIRQDDPKQRGTTHCELACTEGVIHFGDLNDPESDPNVYLRQRIEESGGKLSTFHLLGDLGTKPNVIYIGHQPSRNAEPTEPPVRYEDWGFVEERRIVLEGPDPWFKRVFSR